MEESFKNLDEVERTSLFEQVVLKRVAENDQIWCDLLEMREYADDVEFIRQALKTYHIQTSHYISYFFWSLCSHDFDGCWLVPRVESHFAQWEKEMEDLFVSQNEKK